MKHDRTRTSDEGTHVFDQTNGVVDLGSDEPRSESRRTGASRNSTVAGIAMLTTQKP